MTTVMRYVTLFGGPGDGIKIETHEEARGPIRVKYVDSDEYAVYSANGVFLFMEPA